MNRTENRNSKAENSKSPWWEQILRGEKNGLLAESLRRVAKLSSWGYAAGVKSRDLAYQRGWLRSYRLPQPTICVGNITVGGTGKTPLVIRLARDLMGKGLKPAVLLRGYKREHVQRRPVLVRDPARVRVSVQEAGDEAMELALRLPGACIGVGADRWAAGQAILREYPVDCFILDDGFQHHRLDRDINIVTIDTTDPWGGGELLPAGLLREKPEALRRADAVVLTRAASVAPDRLRILRGQVTGFMRTSSSLMESRHEPRELVALSDHRVQALSALKGRRILAVSGIGNPQSFETSLSQLGAEVIDVLRLEDHEGKPQQVWSWIQANRRAVDWIVMTEKDAMRWTDPAKPGSVLKEVYALRMDLMITAGLQNWNNLIGLIHRLAAGTTHAR